MVKIFFSYAASDIDKFQIAELAQHLESKPGVEKVFYWGADDTGCISTYIERYVSSADTCVFFYSPELDLTASLSEERYRSADLGKHIIRVFSNMKDVSSIIESEMVVNNHQRSPQAVADDIYRLVAKRFDLPPIEPMKNDLAQKEMT
ncbi:MAG: hypothetical protein ACFFC7_05460 [Candidatus Hermodarchaeota archaeon]